MKKLIHKSILWYLRRCGGAFHVNPYGPHGRYIVQMTDRQYHRYTHLAQYTKEGERLLAQERRRRDALEESEAEAALFR